MTNENENVQEKYREVLNNVKREIEISNRKNCPSSFCDEFIGKTDERIKNHIKYIRKLLAVHGIDDSVLDIVEFHYCSSAIHFVGHALEDIAKIANESSAFDFEERCLAIYKKMRGEK